MNVERFLKEYVETYAFDTGLRVPADLRQDDWSGRIYRGHTEIKAIAVNLGLANYTAFDGVIVSMARFESGSWWMLATETTETEPWYSVRSWADLPDAAECAEF